ncbi:IPT/TIG domain-containing protein [Rubrivirga sp. IMCC43871]|uniref:IPT/TIG domain-containing protein n=1 Tax=Rubrivirga sp. IMCC43871 TaxID=3391575 RepID=UPI0039902C66
MLRLARLGIALALVATLAACDFGDGASLYDPDAPRNPAPVISSVSPDGVVLAGVDVVVLEGQNFSPTAAENTVVFDDALGASAAGTVLAATATRLEVRVPNLPNAALRVRVAVRGAQAYSNAVPLPLTPAFVSFGEIGRTEAVYGIAAGADGTLYASLENEGRAVGVTRFSPSGERSEYFASTFPWAGLARVGDELAGVRRIRAVFRLPEGGSQQVIAALQPSTLSLVAIAAGPDGSLYVGGNAPTLYGVAPDGSTTEMPFPTAIRALTVADGTLYAVGTSASGDNRVYALTVAADGSLGAPTPVATLPVAGNAIAVAADGTLYVGLDRVIDPVVQISPTGALAPLYPGVLTGPATGLAYGAGSQLYMVRGVTGTPDILRIETRREGAR